MFRTLLIVSASLGMAGCSATLAEPRPCSPADATSCDPGRSCVAGRCRLGDTPVSSPDALRYVIDPLDVAVLTSGGSGGGGDDLADAVTIGRGSSGTTILLFRFAATWKDDAEIASAFIVLQNLDGVPPSLSPISFETARITEPWLPGVVSWGRQPRLTLPRGAGAMRSRPGAPMRIDVTSLVREWGQRAADDHGIALLARGDDAYGTVIATGASRGAGPRLEVYVK